MRRILFTRPDGGVSVCCPDPQIFPWLSRGGFFGENTLRGFLDRQIEGGIADGRDPDAQRRLVMALAFGECNTQEAYALIRDRDCAHLGTAHELIDFEDLPDHWFRNAWRRSHNGGPVSIDLAKARPIQLSHIANAIAAENRERTKRLDDPLHVNLADVRSRIHDARDTIDLRRIWPKELTQ